MSDRNFELSNSNGLTILLTLKYFLNIIDTNELKYPILDYTKPKYDTGRLPIGLYERNAIH